MIEEIIPKKEEAIEEQVEIREDEINTTVPMKKQIEIFRKKREEIQKNSEDNKGKKIVKKEEKENQNENKKQEENKKHDEDDIAQKPNEISGQNNTLNNRKVNEDTRTPTCFLSFSNDWIYDID